MTKALEIFDNVTVHEYREMSNYYLLVYCVYTKHGFTHCWFPITLTLSVPDFHLLLFNVTLYLIKCVDLEDFSSSFST